MRSFLFVLCAALLLNGVAAANGGRVAALQESVIGSKVGQALKRATHIVVTKATNQKNAAWGTAITFIFATAAVCGLSGCEPGQQMVKDVVQEKTTSRENPFKIGVVYEFDYVQSWWGAQLAAEQANLAGGIDGREIVLYPKTIYDFDKAFTVRVTENLVEKEKVHALVGANRSTMSEFVDEIAALTGVPMVTMGSTSNTITRAGPSIFLSAAPNTFQARVASKYAIEELNAKTAAILFWGQDAYSQDLAMGFNDSFTAFGGEIVSYQGYSYGIDVKDHVFAAALNDSGIINNVVNAQPDVVFIPGFSESGIVAVQLRGAGEDAILLGADGWGSSGGETLAQGGKALHGAIYTDGFSPEAAPEFTQAYEEAFGETPDFLAASGYDATNIVIQAALRTSDNITYATLTQEIAATANYKGATEIVRYDIQRHPLKGVILYTIKDGEVVYLKTVNP